MPLFLTDIFQSNLHEIERTGPCLLKARFAKPSPHCPLLPPHLMSPPGALPCPYSEDWPLLAFYKLLVGLAKGPYN